MTIAFHVSPHFLLTSFVSPPLYDRRTHISNRRPGGSHRQRRNRAVTGLWACAGCYNQRTGNSRAIYHAQLLHGLQPHAHGQSDAHTAVFDRLQCARAVLWQTLCLFSERMARDLFYGLYLFARSHLWRKWISGRRHRNPLLFFLARKPVGRVFAPALARMDHTVQSRWRNELVLRRLARGAHPYPGLSGSDLSSGGSPLYVP